METYVIRMATRRSDKGDADEAELRGVAEHVGSGRREPFRDARELLAFLQTERPRQSEEVDKQ
jgi:hypothetical protein